ncbi:NKP1 (YDR383C) [Zygosaccharomyces parabailii]|nr:NKP1 (YDR383C) [Zygosaccharomyces parabailii]SJM84380.1 uncharacterized protein ZBIST_1619 [Zygosaccharomyces bailii]
MKYQAIADFVDTLESPVSPAEVPESVSKALQRNTSRSSRDALCRRVYELEREQQKRQLEEVLENVGDIPKHMLGSDIRDITFLDRVGAQVSKLPRLAAMQEGNEHDQNTLREYNALREELLLKCRAIEVAKTVMRDSDRDLDTIKRLLSELQDPREFFQSYHDKLMGELRGDQI